MDLNNVITVTKLYIKNQRAYILIGWQPDSFEMYLYLSDSVWKGNFSSNRLAGFSKNLQIPKDQYFKSLKRCLSEEHKDYCYDLKSGFFYWKRKLKNSVVIEGFLPVELDTSTGTQPDLIEVLITLNKHLRYKNTTLQTKFTEIKSDYHKCLKDTEEFLNLKIEMEKALCDKFLDLLNIQKSKMEEEKLRTTGDSQQVNDNNNVILTSK